LGVVPESVHSTESVVPSRVAPAAGVVNLTSANAKGAVAARRISGRNIMLLTLGYEGSERAGKLEDGRRL